MARLALGKRWVLLAAVLLVGCDMPLEPRPGPERGEGLGGRTQPLALSPKQEWTIGLRAYREVMEQFGDQLLPPDHAEVRRVRHITDKIARAAEIEPLQREINLRLRGYRFAWEANVIRDPKVNAFCLPAGKVFVFTGILPVAGNDDAELATVLSHEIAHALAHHASERLAREQSGGGVFRNLRFSRDQESEADHIGLFLMTFAGYDPHRAVAFWESMHRRMANSQHPPEFLSDHPSDEHRIAAMREWVPRAIAGKKAFDEGRIAPAGR
jgi:predicted Zn-dependent protease